MNCRFYIIMIKDLFAYVKNLQYLCNEIKKLTIWKLLNNRN